MNAGTIWPDGKRCCVCLTFDLDAEWVFMGTIPETADMPRRLSLGNYVWDAHVIPRILDLLDEHGVKSTFFVVGITIYRQFEKIGALVEVGQHTDLFPFL